MKIKKTEISGCYVIQPRVYQDDRGCFHESFNHQAFYKVIGRYIDFVQDNESVSAYGVIRWLHAQTGIHSQAKLVRVVQGKVLDVVVDVRHNSPTYGNIVTRILDTDNKKQLFVPKGCLHGFSALEDNTIFSYKCDAYYNKMSEINVNPLDPELGIDWNIASGLEIISEKDQNALSWSQFLDKSLALNRRDNVIRTMEIEKQVDVLFEGTEKESENYSSGPFISSAQGM